jgi:hypothetical protein
MPKVLSQNYERKGKIALILIGEYIYAWTCLKEKARKYMETAEEIMLRMEMGGSDGKSRKDQTTNFI